MNFRPLCRIDSDENPLGNPIPPLHRHRVGAEIVDLNFYLVVLAAVVLIDDSDPVRNQQTPFPRRAAAKRDHQHISRRCLDNDVGGDEFQTVRLDGYRFTTDEIKADRPRRFISGQRKVFVESLDFDFHKIGVDLLAFMGPGES